MMLRMWTFTVLSVIPSSYAMILLALPWRKCDNTVICRGVRCLVAVESEAGGGEGTRWVSKRSSGANVPPSLTNLIAATAADISVIDVGINPWAPLFSAFLIFLGCKAVLESERTMTGVSANA